MVLSPKVTETSGKIFIKLKCIYKVLFSNFRVLICHIFKGLYEAFSTYKFSEFVN